MGAALSFRALCADDIDSVHALHCAAMEGAWSVALWRDVLAPNYRNFVLCKHGIITAVAVFTELLGEAELQMIVVDPASQGEGLGRQLLAHANHCLQQAGIKKVLLEVDADNTPALRLYAHFGFVSIGLRKAYYKHSKGRGDALLMTKDLSL